VLFAHDCYRRPPLSNETYIFEILMKNSSLRVPDVIEKVLTDSEVALFYKKLCNVYEERFLK
jgi:hypothetical protein